MKKYFILLICGIAQFSCTHQEPSKSNSESKASPIFTKSEMADIKYIEIGKRAIEAYSKGDIDAWMSMFADTAVYEWNNLDKITGIVEIDNFWRNRRFEITDTIIFSGEIFLPVKVNQPQGGELPGNYLLSWYYIDVTYNNGAKIFQAVHTVYHFNAHDKVDRVLQFLDRELINKALAQN